MFTGGLPRAPRLAEIGDAEPADPAGEGRDDLGQAMAVGVGLDDGHEPAARSREGREDFRIAAQGAEIDLGPAARRGSAGRRRHFRAASSFWMGSKSPSSQHRTNPSQ